MPLYDFIDGDTIFEKRMSIKEKEQFLIDNPNIKSYFGNGYSNIPLIDPVVLGIRRPDTGFREVLQKIHSKTPGSQLDKTTRF